MICKNRRYQTGSEQKKRRKAKKLNTYVASNRKNMQPKSKVVLLWRDMEYALMSLSTGLGQIPTSFM